MSASPRMPLRDRLTYANVMSTIAVFLLLGGTSYAAVKLPAKSVSDRELAKDAVTTRAIRDGTITTADLAPGTAQGGSRGPRGATGPAGSTGPAQPAAEPWQPLQFVGSWRNVGGEWELGSVRRNNGEVELRGLVLLGVGGPAAGSTIALLPVGYRPSKSLMFVINTGVSNAYASGRLDVNPDGQIVWMGGQTGEDDITSLTGVTFSPA